MADDVKFTMEVGRFTRKNIISEIKSTAFRNDIPVEIEEIKGFLSSTLLVTVKGPMAGRFALAVKKAVDKMNEDN